MAKFGVTEEGFRRKSYIEVLESLHATAREKFGEDINLSNTSFLGMWLQNEAWSISEMWELAEDIYYSPFVDTAEGTSLDNAGKYIASQRKPSQKSRGEITVEGKAGTKILPGFRVSDPDLIKVFETLHEATIGASGSVKIDILSIGTGADLNVPQGTLVEIVNPLSGVTKVYNEESTDAGTKVESDGEFRERYFRSIAKVGGSTREAVEAALLDIENVVDAFVVENDTIETVDGVPPKSIYSLVEGASEEVIANTILKVKAAGIRAYGAIEKEVEDIKGISHTIGFSRPTKKDIYIKLSIVRGNGYIGDEPVKRAVINYIGGEDSDGIFYRGLRLGENVILSRVTSSVMCLGGVEDIRTQISTDGVTWGTSNIVNTISEISRTGNSKVVIEYVD